MGTACCASARVVSRDDVYECFQKIKMFQGTRGGRELWINKARDIQEGDLIRFNKDVELIQAYIEALEFIIDHPAPPPIPPHMYEFFNQYMNEPLNIRSGVYKFAEFTEGEKEVVRAHPVYKDLIAKYDFPAFMELLRKIPKEAIM